MKHTLKQKNFSKITVLLTLLLLIGLTSLSAKAQQTNFTGTWTRDSDKTSLSDGLSINSVPVLLTVSQNDHSISVTRNSVNYSGEKTTYTEKLHFDDSPAKTIINPNRIKNSVFKWLADQKGFIVTADYSDGQGNHVQHNVETWSLSNDGKMLMIHITIDNGDQRFTAEQVFDKQ